MLETYRYPRLRYLCIYLKYFGFVLVQWKHATVLCSQLEDADSSPQFSSSVPSPQSSVPSHTCCSATQPSRLHSIVPAGHSLPMTGTDDVMKEKGLIEDGARGVVQKVKGHLQGRAQSRNSSWSTATSPLWPSDLFELRRIWKVEAIRPRKMVASLQPRTLVASGRHTTASRESWWWTDAHNGAEPRPVWPTGIF